MEMIYKDNRLYINIEDKISFSLIKKLKNRMFYLIDTYSIYDIELYINDTHYDISLINELIDEFNRKYDGKLTVK